ncbi:unnamed protein product [Schistosoma margrebowiei]|uniref:Uncharacterized protein n=1 Tax=Schistosoma margrebowiei TaxID=48269 RepID=A0A3P8CZ05_9TREM|nr:unnamed protein product [Schistosoma margrebowiei]
MLTVQRCDSSKVFPSDNQHDSDSALPQVMVRGRKA